MTVNRIHPVSVASESHDKPVAMAVDSKSLGRDKASEQRSKHLIYEGVPRCKREGREVDVRRATFDCLPGRRDKGIGVTEKL